MTGVDPETDRGPTPSHEASASEPARIDRDIFGRAPTRTRDWSHRRGEPRVFALAWTMYVMASTLTMFAYAGGMGSFTVESYRPAARIAMTLVLIGMVVLWPMTRLSQLAPRRGGVVATLKDAVIIGMPAQAVVWPQLLLARWPFVVVLALSVLFAIWTMLTAAIVAGGIGPPRREPVDPLERPRDDRPWTRSVAMGLALALGVITALAPLLEPAAMADALRTRPAWMVNPILGMYEITRDRSFAGPSAMVGPMHWTMLAALAGLTLAAWAVSLVMALAPPERPGDRADGPRDD